MCGLLCSPSFGSDETIVDRWKPAFTAADGPTAASTAASSTMAHIRRQLLAEMVDLAACSADAARSIPPAYIDRELASVLHIWWKIYWSRSGRQ